jgi:hypothetical protein
MADYINIYGQDILAVASDPANPTLGQIWYNTTSNTLKGGGVTTAGTWATGGSKGTINQGSAAAGTQTAALSAGGDSPVTSPPYNALSEEYNGTSWSSLSPISTGRGAVGGAGDLTAAVIFGGFISTFPGTTATEEYNGSAWSTVNPLLNQIYASGASGTQTAALSAGGAGEVTRSEEYDGTSWALGGSLATGRSNAEGAGTQTASLLIGGNRPPP